MCSMDHNRERMWSKKYFRSCSNTGELYIYPRHFPCFYFVYQNINSKDSLKVQIAILKSNKAMYDIIKWSKKDATHKKHQSHYYDRLRYSQPRYLNKRHVQHQTNLFSFHYNDNYDYDNDDNHATNTRSNSIICVVSENIF